MGEFHETMRGHRFYESTVPRVVKALERIATALEKQIVQKRIKDYTIITHYTMAELSTVVRSYCIKDNYEPVGQPFTTTGDWYRYHQVLIRYEKEVAEDEDSSSDKTETG